MIAWDDVERKTEISVKIRIFHRKKFTSEKYADSCYHYLPICTKKGTAT